MIASGPTLKNTMAAKIPPTIRLIKYNGLTANKSLRILFSTTNFGFAKDDQVVINALKKIIPVAM